MIVVRTDRRRNLELHRGAQPASSGSSASNLSSDS